MLATAETHAPCQVFDANGLEWRYMLWVDTETGEGEQCITDDDGKFQLNVYKTEVLKRRVVLPSPVLLVPIEKREDRA